MIGYDVVKATKLHPEVSRVRGDGVTSMETSNRKQEGVCTALGRRGCRVRERGLLRL